MKGEPNQKPSLIFHSLSLSLSLSLNPHFSLISSTSEPALLGFSVIPAPFTFLFYVSKGRGFGCVNLFDFLFYFDSMFIPKSGASDCVSVRCSLNL